MKAFLVSRHVEFPKTHSIGRLLDLASAVAPELAPSLADAHLNLAMLYEAAGEKIKMRDHLGEYLHYEPNGRWSNYAQSRMPEPAGTPASSRPQPRAKVTPFRKRG